jgi:hypothetical protein
MDESVVVYAHVCVDVLVDVDGVYRVARSFNCPKASCFQEYENVHLLENANLY